MNNPMDLSGSRILVTGASSGIGRATAILLSQLGASLILTGRDQNRLELTRGQLDPGNHQVAAFDLSLLDKIPGWLKNLSTEFGHFDGLVHSAGIHAAAPLKIVSASALDEMMRINFHSAVMLARGFRQKGCHAPDGGSIVFLGSAAGLVGEPGVSAYSASKAALLGLTRSLAMELAPERIRVNAVAPGFVETEMSNRLRETLTEEQFEIIRANHPLGLGSARDVANGIAFLVARSARWITGTTLIIDGGYTTH